LIHQAVEAELQELLEAHSDRRTEDGKAGVVRNGYLPERELQTGVGPVTVRIPKVRAKTGDPVTFRSALVPPYVRKTKSLEAALPWLYLKGVSSGEMSEALAVLVGQDAKGLSASTVSRLKQVWAEEYSRWREARLNKDRWVYVWVDGVYSGLSTIRPICPARPTRRRTTACCGPKSAPSTTVPPMRVAGGHARPAAPWSI
jgi:putative transposase